MNEDIYFKSKEHQQRFLSAMQELGKIYDGRLDQEYGAALYILTADSDTWEKANSYVERNGIDIAAMLSGRDWSGGLSVLVALAGNLFNGQERVDPVDFAERLDQENFQVALCAIKVRRSGWHMDEVKP